MHIVSASRRTDIPAFHAEWFMHRLAAEHVYVRSPFGGGLHRVSLSPNDVAAIVFWTKNAAPLVQHLQEIQDRGHSFTFLYTVNNYPSSMEPLVPHWSHNLKTMELLARSFPRSAIRWRYDTIVLTDTLDRAWHMENFSLLCREMAPFTRECIFSFCDYYKKTVRNLDQRAPSHHRPNLTESRDMAEEMAQVAQAWGIQLSSCAHDLLVSESVAKAKCIDPKVLLGLTDSADRVDAIKRLKPAPSRKECGCAASRDIGAYDTCLHGCAYCYANASPEAARQNVAGIEKDAPCLDPRVTVPRDVPEPQRQADLWAGKPDAGAGSSVAL